VALADTLAEWLPGQRWYPGTAPPRDLAITSDITVVSGDPELRHLIVTVTDAGIGGQARYQVLAGIGSRLPGTLAGQAPVIGPAGCGRVAYDALYDRMFTAILLSGIAGQRSIGPLRFATCPGASIAAARDGTVLNSEQTNTSVVFGRSAILKVLRRVTPGPSPDLEITRALAQRGCPHVAEPLGWIELAGDPGPGGPAGEPTVLAVLSRYLCSDGDGWSLALSSLAARTRGEQGPGAAGGDFAAEARLLGAATARVHAHLAAAFGTGQMSADQVAELARQMSGRLDLAERELPALAAHGERIRARFRALADLGRPLPVQRVHGDYHLGQVLRTPGRHARPGSRRETTWVLLDFEGEPSVPLEQRRAPAPALRDVAGMLRSFDYAAQHALRHQPGGGPGEPALSAAALAWARSAGEAFCSGYAAAGGLDPAAHVTALRALVLDKAVYEAVYEARHRPSWLPIPMQAIAAA
jgi:maltokinase